MSVVPSIPAAAVPSALPTSSVPTASPAAAAQPISQNRYKSTAEDQQLISKFQTGPTEDKPTPMTPAHALAARSIMLVECLQV